MWKKLESTFRNVVGGASEQSTLQQPKMPLRKTPLTAQEFDMRQVVEYGTAVGNGQARLAIHPLLNILAVASAGRVRVFGSEGVEVLFEGIQKQEIIYAAWCPMGMLSISSSTVEIWDVAENAPFPAEKSFPVTLTAAHYLPGSDFAIVGDEAGTVHIVNFTKPLSVALYKITIEDAGGSGAVVALQVHPTTEQMLLIAYANGVVVEWDIIVRKVTRKLLVPMVPPPPLTPPPPIPTTAPPPPTTTDAPAAAAAANAPPTTTTPPPSSAPPPASVPPKIPTVICAAYGPDGERIVAGTSEGDLFWWKGSTFVNKMRVSDGEGPRRPVRKIVTAKLKNDELLFVMGGTLRSRPDSVSLIKGSVGLAALSFTTDEEAPIDYCLLYDGPHPSEASPTHLLCLTSRGQVIVEAFVHDPKGQYQLAMLPSPPSWLQFYPSAGLTSLELSSDFVINTLLLMLPDPTNVEATGSKVDKLWPVRGGVRPKLSSSELLFTGHQDGVVRLWSLEYTPCLLREFSAHPKVAVTHLQIHERAKILTVGFANGRFMLLSVPNIFRIADKPQAEKPQAEKTPTEKTPAATPEPTPPASPLRASPSHSAPPSPSSANPPPSSPRSASPSAPIPQAPAAVAEVAPRASSPQRVPRMLPDEVILQAELEGTVTLAAVAPDMCYAAFAALGGDVVVYDLCTNERIVHQSFPHKIISSILIVSLPPPIMPPLPPQGNTPPPQSPSSPPPPPVATAPPSDQPQAIIATSTGDLYFINLNSKASLTVKLPCAIVGLWALNWRGEPIANAGPPLDSQAAKHEPNINPQSVFLLACAESEVCLFTHPNMELVMRLELPFKVWKAQLVKRDVEYSLAVAESCGKVHIVAIPHLELLARDLTISQDLRFQDIYLFEHTEAIGVHGSGTHVTLVRAFIGTNEYCLPKGKVKVAQPVQWPERNRGFFASLLGGDQRRLMKELFLRKPDPPPAAANAPEAKRKELQRNVGDVRDIMQQNIQKLNERGEKLSEISQRTAEMENTSKDFAANVHALTQKLQKKGW